jgi:serine/threonine-protein kinase
MPQAQSALHPGALIDDQYRLQRQIGSGGVGTVWEADHLRLGGSVAIKFLHEALLNHAEIKLRFVREARSASRLRSPHVVQVLDQGTTAAGVPYLVMELLEGEDLRARLDRVGPFRLAEAAVIVDQIARALRKAHREGLVHRDIKPHNVFLIPEDDRPFVKLLDFGIAKEVAIDEKAVTLTGALMGSAHYMSPEQIDDPKSVGPSTDIWALGVVVYEMLTGVVPFDGGSVPDVLKRVQQATFEPPSRSRLDLPSELDAWFERAIQPDRARRFASVEDMSRTFCQIARAHSSSFFEPLPSDITQDTAIWSTPPAIAPDPAAHSLLARALHAPWYRKIMWGMAGLLALALVSLAIMRARSGRENLGRLPAARPATFTPPAALAESTVQPWPAHSADDSRSASVAGDSRSASVAGDSRSASVAGDSRSASAAGDSRSASVAGDSRSASVAGDSRSASVAGDSRSASVAGDSRSASAAGDSRSASVAGDSRSVTPRRPRGPRATSAAKPGAGEAATAGDAQPRAPSIARPQLKDRGF